jgi:ribosome recycling factor
MDTTTAKDRMNQALDHLHEELKKVRTGRASAQVLEGIKVEVYGAMTPLSHMANVVALDGQTLQVQPFDPNNLDAISAAIRNDQSLGLNPSDDGKVVRIAVPPMTEDRRRDVVKHMGETVEATRIAVRNIRHDELNDAKSLEKSGDISKDDLIGFQKDLDALIADINKQIEESARAKEEEILKV